jgi:hypothetical protein
LTHGLYDYEAPQILVLQGYETPFVKNDSKAYFKAICIIFTPWKFLIDLHPNGDFHK